MAAVQGNSGRKRPVNLTLNEDLVLQAKGMTRNLSAVVESLLAAYVAQQGEEQLARAHRADATSAAWNAFNERSGSFADEYSTL